MINLMNDQRIFIDHGPIQMMIDIYIDGLRNPKLGKFVAEDVVCQFEELLKCIDIVKSSEWSFGIREEFPEVLKKMISAVEAVGDKTFTPLAAVAGSFSEYALERAIAYGAGRVIINNGGDIALKDLEGNSITVGVPLENDLGGQKLVFEVLHKSGIEGICTSGFGGRSFTKGIADKAVAFGSKASIADVCATYIANETNVEDENIIRAMAEEIDSGTDIKGHLVTVKVGNVSKEKKLKALLNGYSVLEKLYDRGIIKGGAVLVGDDILLAPENFACIKNRMED